MKKILNNFNNFTPVAVYENTKLQKKQILCENNGKTGIYRWVNKVNGKSYIGSAIDLVVRFHVYYSVKRLENSNMPIYKALLKYDHSNFKLEILEYCDKENVISREQHYLDLLSPEYNILTEARSSLGYKHTEETLAKFQERKFSEEQKAKLSAAATGRKLSEDTKAKLSANRIGTKLSD